MKNNTAVCTCPSGYTDVNNDGSSCVDIDECASSSTNSCDPNATCHNTVGSYTCTCNWPYYGDGKACTAPSDLNWDFEDWTDTNPPRDFEKSASTKFTLTDDTSNVNSGAHSCNATWTTTSNRDLIDAMYAAATPGTEYTVHIWMNDNDVGGRARPFLTFYDSAKANPSNYYSTVFTDDKTPAGAWYEYTETTSAPPNAAYVRGAVRFYDVSANWTGSSTIYVDDFDLTQHVTFNVGDSTLDTLTGKPSGPPELIASPLAIHAALNDQGWLYASMPPADSSTGDHMLLVWVGGVSSTATIKMPWSKNGTVPAPASGGSVFALVQEQQAQSNGYCEWDEWDPGITNWKKISNACSGNSSSGVLEGDVDLVTGVGVSSPDQLPGMLDFSALDVGTNNGDSLDQSLQTPACTAPCDSNVDASEVLAMHRARVLVGRVQP